MADGMQDDIGRALVAYGVEPLKYYSFGSGKLIGAVAKAAPPAPQPVDASYVDETQHITVVNDSHDAPVQPVQSPAAAPAEYRPAPETFADMRHAGRPAAALPAMVVVAPCLQAFAAALQAAAANPAMRPRPAWQMPAARVALPSYQSVPVALARNSVADLFRMLAGRADDAVPARAVAPPRSADTPYAPPAYAAAAYASPAYASPAYPSPAYAQPEARQPQPRLPFVPYRNAPPQVAPMPQRSAAPSDGVLAAWRPASSGSPGIAAPVVTAGRASELLRWV